MRRGMSRIMMTVTSTSVRQLCSGVQLTLGVSQRVDSMMLECGYQRNYEMKQVNEFHSEMQQATTVQVWELRSF